MRRLIVAVAVAVLFAPAAFAAVTVQRGDRIAMLRPADGEVDTWLLNRVRVNVTNELRSLGIDAFDARQTYADAQATRRSDARYLLEVRSARTATRVVPVDVAPVTPGVVPTGAAATGPVSAVMVPDTSTTIDLELRLYDAATFDLVRTYEVHENVSTSPAFGAGPRFFFLIPFPRYVSSRQAASAAAREAALKIANVNQIE